MRTMRMEREDIENSLKVLSHIVDDDFTITVDEARKIIGIDGETIQALQAEVEELKRVNMELFDDLPKYGDKILHWVSVEKLMPEKSQNVLVANKRGKVFDIDKAWWNGLYFDRCGKRPYWNVTHWMPLPDPPQEVKP